MAPRILVVDDDPVILELLEEHLQDQGADVVTSDFPDDIATLIGQVQPDVLLLDLISPTDTLAGVTMLGRLYDALQGALRLPVLLMSGNEVWLSAVAPRLQLLGGGVVPKPIDLERLWQMIEQAAHRSSAGALPI